jgi:hypothetical protein
MEIWPDNRLELVKAVEKYANVTIRNIRALGNASKDMPIPLLWMISIRFIGL